MADGWNPLFKTLLPRSRAEEALYLWTNSYPKAAAIAQVGLYKITGRIESGKMLNLLLLFSSFGLSLFALCRLKKIGAVSAALCALLASLNPIVVCQAFTFYVDGFQASLFLCLASLLFLYCLKPDNVMSILLVLAGACFLNVKYTALLAFAILGGGCLVLLVLNRRTDVWGRVVGVLVLSSLLGIVLGPFVRNALEHGHPLYPILRADGKDVTEVERPHALTPMRGPHRLLVSLFSESTTARDRTQLKPPFLVSENEILEFFFPDVRLGGFGPLFSGVLILSLFLLFAAREQLAESKSLSIVIALLLLSVVLNPESWWARYVYQLWLVPILVLVLANSGRPGLLTKLSTGVTAATILLNVMLISVPHTWMQFHNSQWVRRQLDELAQRPQPLKVNFGEFRANRVRFAEHHIAYVEITDIPESKAIELFHSQARILKE